MINSAAEYFNEKRNIYLSGVLTKIRCEELTKHIFELLKAGKMERDKQCPLSWSVYGDPILDGLLSDLTPHLSEQLGIQLLPAYSYARIYQTGDVLKRHIDRESCEISGTMTLGFDSDSELWPIFFAKNSDDIVGYPVDIHVGDLLMYRGNELPHWRPQYKGKWQVQVFFHYVDANGPHKDFVYDKRPCLGIDKGPSYQELKQTMNQVSKPEEVMPVESGSIIYDGVMIPSWNNISPGSSCFHSQFKPELTFTKEECNRIISLASSKYSTKATVGTESSKENYQPKIRRVDLYTIGLAENTKWIFEKICKAVSIANHEYYNYEIMGVTHDLQLLHYKDDEKSFYDWHVDIGAGNASTRKISVSVQLSDPNSYEGGDLVINDNGVIINTIKEQGCINMFPSYALHQVTPVTKGERWVIVIWVHGSQRFK